MEKTLWRYGDFQKAAAAGPLPAWLMYGIGLVAVVNFVAFFFSTLYFGGEAVSGYEAGGRYYLGYKGKLTEVSRTIFEYSLWQTRSVFVTHPLAMLVWGMAWHRSRRLGQF